MPTNPNSVEVVISNHLHRLQPAIDAQIARYPREILDEADLADCLLQDIMHYCDDKQVRFDLVLKEAKTRYYKRKAMMAKNEK